MGINPMTVERILRILGAEKLTPPGTVGRRTADFNVVALAHVILAFGAVQPADAADAVRRLSQLRSSPNLLATIGNAEQPGDQLLIEWICAMIEKLADTDYAAKMLAEHGSSSFYERLVLNMNVADRAVYISWNVKAKSEQRSLWFVAREQGLVPEEQRHRRVSVSIDIHVLAAAGRLLADTLARQPTLIPKPAPGSAGKGDAYPEKMKATGPGSHGGLHEYPAPNKAQATLHDLERIEDSLPEQEASNQPLAALSGPGSRGCNRGAIRHRVQPPSRSMDIGTYWTDAASP